MSTIVTVAKYFTPKIVFEAHHTEKYVNRQFLPEGTKIDGKFTATADGWVAHFLWAGCYSKDPMFNSCRITATVEEWFEVQFRSDGRFYYLNDQGDEFKVRNACMLGSPNKHSIGAIQFPSKDFSYTGAIMDESIFRFYSTDRDTVGFCEIKYIAPRGSEFGPENIAEAQVL
jgi:hypothetical protein